ncbi:50S ribosomal protein L29 [Candidatus Dojkabacteria bacterium]|nr:50S ribosomal protein L29 [Candidatus Dojkabacteria bacterium]
MDIKKLKELKPEDLKERLSKRQEELVSTKYDVKMGVEKNYKKILMIRREIARINTLLNL